MESRAALEAWFRSPLLGEEVVAGLAGPESGVVWTCVSEDTSWLDDCKRNDWDDDEVVALNFPLEVVKVVDVEEDVIRKGDVVRVVGSVTKEVGGGGEIEVRVVGSVKEDVIGEGSGVSICVPAGVHNIKIVVVGEGTILAEVSGDGGTPADVAMVPAFAPFSQVVNLWTGRCSL